MSGLNRTDDLLYIYYMYDDDFLYDLIVEHELYCSRVDKHRDILTCKTCAFKNGKFSQFKFQLKKKLIRHC